VHKLLSIATEEETAQEDKLALYIHGHSLMVFLMGHVNSMLLEIVSMMVNAHLWTNARIAPEKHVQSAKLVKINASQLTTRSIS